MKRLFVISFLILSFSAFGQMKGKVYNLDVDTSKGADTIYFNLPKITGSGSNLIIEAIFTEIGGTSDGIAFVQSSIDTIDGGNFVSFNNDINFITYSYPNDSVTITNGGYGKWTVIGIPDIWYRLVINGTSGDTTKINAKYLVK